MGGTLKILELAALHRPQERDEADQAHTKAKGGQPDRVAHVAASNCMAIFAPCGLFAFRLAALERRRALATTRIEEEDIATAAISGVTYPATARGRANKLYTIESVMFCITSRLAVRAMLIASGTLSRLEPRKTRSAALRPTSAAEEGAIDT